MERHELVDENGNNTGIVFEHEKLRDINNLPKGYYISVVGVVIVNDKNEVLLQKRSMEKRVNPGKWGICGGKANVGETRKESGVRETFEEVGVKLEEDELHFIHNERLEHAYFTIFYARKNVDISKCKLQVEEVDEVKFFKLEEIDNLDTEGLEWMDDLKKELYK